MLQIESFATCYPDSLASIFACFCRCSLYLRQLRASSYDEPWLTRIYYRIGSAMARPLGLEIVEPMNCVNVAGADVFLLFHKLNRR